MRSFVSLSFFPGPSTFLASRSPEEGRREGTRNILRHLYIPTRCRRIRKAVRYMSAHREHERSVLRRAISISYSKHPLTNKYSLGHLLWMGRGYGTRRSAPSKFALRVAERNSHVQRTFRTGRQLSTPARAERKRPQSPTPTQSVKRLSLSPSLSFSLCGNVRPCGSFSTSSPCWVENTNPIWHTYVITALHVASFHAHTVRTYDALFCTWVGWSASASTRRKKEKNQEMSDPSISPCRSMI